ncbi:MAG: tRNA (adenosine(37)-N6)-dimethylallyltransferase MiaA [Janthinobacterium lividum]
MTIVIVGPTASGKSGLAIALAQAYAARGRRAEVVSADSMLVYRGMDVGTAKPTSGERAGVVHHLVDVLDVTETATVAQFQTMARAAVGDCLARGVVPILVGGSALYVRAVVDAFEFPGTDPVVRARLESELAEVGPEALHARLAETDPAAAARIEPANGRRVVRALEVGELTGRPYAAELPERRYALPDVVQIGLDVPRPALDERIRRRVDLMWEAGLVAEVRLLEQVGLRDGVTASRALGYRQVLQHLDGEIDEAAAREATVVATRRFARRQDGWFRKDERIGWLAHDRPDLVEATLVLARAAGGGP